MKEIWKDVVGYEGLYKVSSIGRVKRLWKNHDFILKGDVGKKGYIRVTLYGKDFKKKRFMVHVLVTNAFLRLKREGEVANHLDRNPSNNSIENLEICTASENCFFSVRKRSKSRYRGVTFKWDAKRKKPWCAHIKSKFHGNKILHLGYYYTAKEAHNVYVNKAIELYGKKYCSVL